MIYFLHIAYDGTNFRGWQFQKNVESVQETIEKKLEQIFKKPVPVFGCGRTDAGVHASQYVLHIELEPFDFDLKFRLNKNLPHSISVYDILEMEDGRHSRFDASSRTYDYFIHLYKDPFLNRFSTYYHADNLNFGAMHEAVKLISECSDFKTLCKQAHLYKHTICNITEAKLVVDASKKHLKFTITADRFLRGMIRIIVANLLKIGSGDMSIEEFKLLLEDKWEVLDNASAPPNGLFLSRVEYPYLKFTPQDRKGVF